MQSKAHLAFARRAKCHSPAYYHNKSPASSRALRNCLNLWTWECYPSVAAALFFREWGWKTELWLELLSARRACSFPFFQPHIIIPPIQLLQLWNMHPVTDWTQTCDQTGAKPMRSVAKIQELLIWRGAMCVIKGLLAEIWRKVKRSSASLWSLPPLRLIPRHQAKRLDRDQYGLQWR